MHYRYIKDIKFNYNFYSEKNPETYTYR